MLKIDKVVINPIATGLNFLFAFQLFLSSTLNFPSYSLFTVSFASPSKFSEFGLILKVKLFFPFLAIRDFRNFGLSIFSIK
jgi:hypothetical protein